MKLEACPFCGSEQATTPPCETITDDDRPEVTWTAICKACGARVDRDTEADAIAAWNTRAIEATRPTDEVVERVAKIIDPVWMNPPEGHHVLENYPGQADKYRDKSRDLARAAIAAMKDAAHD